MTELDWNAQIGQARSMHTGKASHAQRQDPLPRGECPERLSNGAPCGKDVAPGQELCQSHRALDRESRRIDEWFGRALGSVCECELSEQQERQRLAIVEAVGMLSRNPRRRVKPLRVVGEVLMVAVTGQKPPAKPDPMAKEWGSSGA